MKKIIFILLFLTVTGLIILKTFFNINQASSGEYPSVNINNKIIKVTIADDLSEQTQGLSDHPGIKKDEGMLFVFDTSQKRRFWMKKMNFPLDIVWIKDNKIIKIDKNLPPEGDNPKYRYSSEKSINYVLEVNGGYCDNNKIKVGDLVEYDY